MTSSKPKYLIVSAIQELQHVMKEYMEKMGAMFNNV